MNDLLRQKLCDIVAAHGAAVADDPHRCGELLRGVAPEDGDGVEALLRALEARVPARLTLLTEPLALAPLTSGLVRRLVDEQGLSEDAARWAVETWATALGKGNDAGMATAGSFPAYEYVLAPPRRRRRYLWYALAILAVLAAVGVWWWNSQRAEVRRMVGQLGPVDCMALSADGHTLLAGYRDKSLVLWDVDSGDELRRFTGHEGNPLGVALSPDGRLALSCGGTVPQDCLIRTWDVETGEQRKPFGQSPIIPTLTPVLVSALGGVGSAQYPMLLLTGLTAVVSPQYPVPVRCVGFSSDGRLALAGMGDYELKGGQYTFKDERPVPVDCVVCLFDPATGREVRRLGGHWGPVYCAVFTPDGKRVVSGSGDGAIRLWDAATGQQLKSTKVDFKAPVVSLAVSPNGRRLLSGDIQSRIALWDLDTLELLDETRKTPQAVRAVAFSPDGTRALSGGDDYMVRLWDAENLTELRHFPGHIWSPSGVAFLPDGRRAVSSSYDGTIRVWRLP